MRIQINLLPRLTVLLLSLGVVLSGSLRAQTPGEEDTLISFRITRFDLYDQPPPEFEVRQGDKRIPVDVPLNYIDGPIKGSLRDNRYLDFFKAGGEVPLISVQIPQGQLKDILLVFFAKKEKGTYLILPVYAPLSKIKGGDRFIINVSDTEVAIQYGEEVLVLDPLKTGLLSSPEGQKIGSVPVVIMEKSPDGWRPFSTESWSHDPRVRKFLFIYRSERTKHLRFHGVSDRLDFNKPSDPP